PIESIILLYTNISLRSLTYFLFFFHDTAPTEIYTLSLHDALPICVSKRSSMARSLRTRRLPPRQQQRLSRRRLSRAPRLRSPRLDRKSTRLNSSHSQISYAVFCLKKKKELNE